MKCIHVSDSLHRELKIKAAKESVNLNILIAHILWDKVGGVRAGANK